MKMCSLVIGVMVSNTAVSPFSMSINKSKYEVNLPISVYF